ncbi:hypothetical protein [Flavobacterium johnsoniae]|jgi:hypothetical protein|uniref:hypothetical protein n=1 Tax=Flavobacterium johnsoniae TaxID=986 RepID=UPI003D968FC3
MNEIENLYKYIDSIKTKTAMYIGERSLSALYFYINGYQAACVIKGIDEKLEPSFDLFHDFTADYYLRGESTAGWKNIILAECFGNEEQALDTFFVLFDDFRKRGKAINSKKILISLLEKIILNQENSEKLKSDLPIKEYNELGMLLNKIASVEFLSDCDDILKEITALSRRSENLKSLLPVF